jgi:hypothetical protein
MSIRDTLSGYAVTTMDNGAKLINMVARGARQWVKHSDMIWISTAVAYYATDPVNSLNWLNHPVDKVEAAKFVAIASSLYAIFQGCFGVEQLPSTNKGESVFPNKTLIILTNSMATALYVAYRFEGIRALTAIEGILMTGLLCIPVKIVHDQLYKETK